MKPMVVVINGIGGSGKDTFVECCKKVCKIGIDNISTIDIVKEAAQILGWENDKTDNGRKFLSDLKKLSVKYNDCPYQYCKENIMCSPPWNIVFVHCREPKEIERFVQDFDAKTLLIRRPDIDIPQNESDMNVENYPYDYIVVNDGTIEDLKIKADVFIGWLMDEMDEVD